ncbi:NAD(P)-binding protein [Auricularia subglabra TFB-10046 SS5]|nr:NAD(P)-binding protein [Auricularia subglabra TFB-10046 SS5]
MSRKHTDEQPSDIVNRIEKVAIVGAGGNIGGYFVRELLKTGKHVVTALTRQGSSSTLPEGVISVAVDYEDASTLVAALKGQQFLIITLGVAAPPETQSKLIRAAAAAGVAYVMPNAYGPDPLNAQLMADVLVGPAVTAATSEIEALGVSKWVLFGCGFWYEWSLLGGPDRCGIDSAGRTMTFFDGGDEKITLSTWDQCGRALAAFLSLKLHTDDDAPAIARWANKCLYFASFRVSQKDMFESVKRVSGTTDADWKVSYVKSQERFKEAHESVMKAGDALAFQRLFYSRVFFPTGEGDHTCHGLANEILGLPQGGLDDATKEAYRLLEQRRLTY